MHCTAPNSNVPHRLRLGVAEWIGLATLALTPASAFTWWGYQMSQRVTTIEVRQETVIRNLDTMARQFGDVVRLDERIKALDERVNRLDATNRRTALNPVR